MAQRIDPHCLERLMRQHGAALELFAAQWTPQPEDCVQEAFLKLVRERTPPDRVVAWLYRVVRNQAISWQRSSARRRRRESAVVEERSTWFTSPDWTSLELEEVTETLSGIDDELREVVIARIWGGLSYEQIADVIGASTSTAHRRYEAGLQELRERLSIKWDKSTSPTNA